jgi:hypothetical protein
MRLSIFTFGCFASYALITAGSGTYCTVYHLHMRTVVSPPDPEPDDPVGAQAASSPVVAAAAAPVAPHLSSVRRSSCDRMKDDPLRAALLPCIFFSPR